MQEILMWIAGISLVLAVLFSGALVSGDRMRVNDYAETSADRSWRSKAALVCFVVGLLSGLVAWLLN